MLKATLPQIWAEPVAEARSQVRRGNSAGRGWAERSLLRVS